MHSPHAFDHRGTSQVVKACLQSLLKFCSLLTCGDVSIAPPVLQYAEFLRLAIDKDQYRDMMPSLGDLLRPDKYALEPEVAFLLYRPILSRVPFPKPPASKESEDGEIPDGGEVLMEVEQGG